MVTQTVKNPESQWCKSKLFRNYITYSKIDLKQYMCIIGSGLGGIKSSRSNELTRFCVNIKSALLSNKSFTEQI